MIEHFSQCLSDTSWLIFEHSWEPGLQNVSEVQLALGNGYIGSRAILEEIPAGSCPGTFFAGIYDKTGAQVTEMVNAPNPIDFRISVDGEKLDPIAMDVLFHTRILDMRKGFLARKTVYSNVKKKRFDYQSLRFFSMDNPHIAVTQIYLTPLDSSANLTITTSVDTSVTNEGLITEGRKRHVNIVESSLIGNINFLCTKTLEKEILLTYASYLRISRDKKSLPMPHRKFELSLERGETVCFTKFFSFYTSREVNPKRIRSETIKVLQKAVKEGFDKLFEKHCQAWKEKWAKADIQIEGAPDIQRIIRFNIYHLLIAANEENNDASIGAKALTGEGYRGHIFWDTEIFILPFFIYTNPSIAKKLLLYRYNRLEEAKKIAQEKGYEGAMFPWESADTGEDVTPQWYKDSNGEIKKVTTMKFEHHITADIPYAFFHYFLATNDINFMFKYGLEVFLETAKFWSSRVEYDRFLKKYKIKNVSGPDEFHENVNNNSYTNMLAKWNLITATKLSKVLKRRDPEKVKEIIKKVNLKMEEIENFKKIAEKIYIPISKRKIFEEFEGYFRKKKLPLPDLDNNLIPLFPKNVRNLGETQYIKQADVVMLLYLLSDVFSKEVKKKNFLFYERRTLHQSSLSFPTHAIVALDAGEKDKAYRYFLNSAYADLKNIYGNTASGIHIASAGGTWQVVVNGFAGVKIIKGILSFEPKLPTHWKKIKFYLNWKGFLLSVNVEKEKIGITFKSKSKKDFLNVRIYGSLQKLYANKMYSFPRKKIKREIYIPPKEFY